MNKSEEILIENDLFKFVTTLYDSYLEDAKDEIKTRIKQYCKENQLKEAEVVKKLNSLMKSRNSNYPKKDLLKWFPEYEEQER